MSKTSRIGLAAVLLVVAMLASACGSDDERVVTVYSGRSENLMMPLFDEFERQSGITVQVRWGSSTDLALLVAEEGEQTQADVFISRSPGPVGFLDAKGLLATMDSSVLDLVGAEHRGANGTWIGFSGRKRVLVHNLDSVPPSELPDSVFELTDPKWRGRVAIPATNGSFVDWFTVFRDQYGNDVATQWLDDMVANDARNYPNNVSIVDAAARGEIDVGLVNHYYNHRMASDAEAAGREHRAANYDLSDEDIGSLLIITAATMTANADDREAAQELITYLLSPSAQRYFTNSTYEYPLAGDVDPNPVLPRLSALSIGSVDFDALGGGFETTEEIIQSSGILSQ